MLTTRWCSRWVLIPHESTSNTTKPAPLPDDSYHNQLPDNVGAVPVGRNLRFHCAPVYDFRIHKLFTASIGVRSILCSQFRDRFVYSTFAIHQLSGSIMAWVIKISSDITRVMLYRRVAYELAAQALRMKHSLLLFLFAGRISCKQKKGCFRS